MSKVSREELIKLLMESDDETVDITELANKVRKESSTSNVSLGYDPNSPIEGTPAMGKSSMGRICEENGITTGDTIRNKTYSEPPTAKASEDAVDNAIQELNNLTAFNDNQCNDEDWNRGRKKKNVPKVSESNPTLIKYLDKLKLAGVHCDDYGKVMLNQMSYGDFLKNNPAIRGKRRAKTVAKNLLGYSGFTIPVSLNTKLASFRNLVLIASENAELGAYLDNYTRSHCLYSEPRIPYKTFLANAVDYAITFTEYDCKGLTKPYSNKVPKAIIALFYVMVKFGLSGEQMAFALLRESSNAAKYKKERICDLHSKFCKGNLFETIDAVVNDLKVITVPNEEGNAIVKSIIEFWDIFTGHNIKNDTAELESLVCPNLKEAVIGIKESNALNKLNVLRWNIERNNEAGKTKRVEELYTKLKKAYNYIVETHDNLEFKKLPEMITSSDIFDVYELLNIMQDKVREDANDNYHNKNFIGASVQLLPWRKEQEEKMEARWKESDPEKNIYIISDNGRNELAQER